MTRLQYPIQIHFGYDIHQVFKNHALFLFNDLNDNKYVYRLVVPEYTKIHTGALLRQTESNNTLWYRKLSEENMGRYPKSRSGLDRVRHLNSLKRLLTENDRRFIKSNNRYSLDWFYRKFIFERLTEGYTHMDREVPPNAFVRNYFINKGLVAGKSIEVPF